jgi:endoglucanase
MTRRRLLPLLVFALLCVAPAAASANAAVSSSSQGNHYGFGTMAAGSSRSTTLQVTNTGVDTITITGIGVEGGDTSILRPTGGTCSKGTPLRPVSQGDPGCTVIVTFSPRVVGNTSGRLVVSASNSLVPPLDRSANPFPLTGGAKATSCDDSLYSGARDKANPLVLPAQDHTAGASNPIQGAHFFVDKKKGLTTMHNPDGHYSSYLERHGSLYKIANQPENKRFSRFTAGGSASGVQSNVRNFLCRIPQESPGSIPTASIYRIHHDRCGHAGDSSGEQNAYRSWIRGLAKGIGRQPMVLFYEFDALITVGCLSHNGLNARIGELQYGLKTLQALPHTVIYIDAGAADALSYKSTAKLLNRVGIGGIGGFFLNATHYDWTSNEVAYGRKVSALVGHKHFVVSTSVNGRGPLRPKNRVSGGNEVLCNPRGRGLGIKPTTNTGQSSVDGFLWIGNAGLSGGSGPKCNNGPKNGRFFLAYALQLVAHANQQYGPGTKSLPY